MPKKIKDLELDLQIKILEISSMIKWTKSKQRDYNFYLKISNLLEQTERILEDITLILELDTGQVASRKETTHA